MKVKNFILHLSALTQSVPRFGDEEQVYRSYRRMTCWDATARVVLPTPGTSEAFSQNRQAIGETKGKAVVYKSYRQSLPQKFWEQLSSHSGWIAKVVSLFK